MPQTPDPRPQTLGPLLRPKSIAVVGASANPDSPGHDYLQCLVDFGFKGDVYPVHRREPEILGLRAYPSLADIPGEVEFVISVIPQEGILDLIEQAAAKGVRCIQLFTGRFSETGREDAADLEREVLRRAREGGVALIGPNCMGLHDPGWGLSFRPDLPRRLGGAAFISQSGNNTTEVLLHSEVRGVGYRMALSYGNALDVTESDLIEYLADEGDVRVVGAYIEGVRDGRHFVDAVTKASARKPVVIFKGGRSSAGARSAVSHTAALAGSSQVWSAALRQAGAIQVRSQEELIDLLVAFELWGAPKAGVGRNVGAVGGGGGRAVATADACDDEGLAIPPLTDGIRAQLKERAPQLWDWVGNPVDQSILAGGGVSGAAILEMMLADPAFDLLIANVGEDWVLGRPDSGDRLLHLVNRFAGIGKESRKPIAYVLGPADSPDEDRWRAVEGARTALVEAGLAVFPTVERAAWALRHYVGYWEGRSA